jgi:hypothetical protein
MDDAREARVRRRRAGETAGPPVSGSAALRWLLIWAVLAGIYVAATVGYRAATGNLEVGAEDFAQWAAVPWIETGALALVHRLRRKR